MRRERLSSFVNEKTISTALISAILFCGIQIRTKELSASCCDDEYEGGVQLNEREKIVWDLLTNILRIHGIDLLYETHEVYFDDRTCKNGKNKKTRTVPDFSFKCGGIHFLIEVGAKNNDTTHKNSQLGVFQNGLDTNGSSPTFMYVQLDDGDIQDLHRVNDLSGLLDYLSSRKRQVTNV